MRFGPAAKASAAQSTAVSRTPGESSTRRRIGCRDSGSWRLRKKLPKKWPCLLDVAPTGPNVFCLVDPAFRSICCVNAHLGRERIKAVPWLHIPVLVHNDDGQ